MNILNCPDCGGIHYGSFSCPIKHPPKPINWPRSEPLKCPGVGRDKDCVNALQFYFSRPVTDDEMRFLHEVMQRAVAQRIK